LLLYAVDQARAVRHLLVEDILLQEDFVEEDLHQEEDGLLHVEVIEEHLQDHLEGEHLQEIEDRHHGLDLLLQREDLVHKADLAHPHQGKKPLIHHLLAHLVAVVLDQEVNRNKATGLS